MLQVLLFGWSRRCVQAHVTSNSIHFRCSLKVMIVVVFVLLLGTVIVIATSIIFITFVLVGVLFFPFLASYE